MGRLEPPSITMHLVERWAWEGLPRATFCCYTMKKREMGKIFIEPPFATIECKKMGKGKGLPRATFCDHKMVEMGEG